MGALLRWVFTLSLIVTTLASGQGMIYCSGTSDHATVSSDENLPECCRDGFCPHHAHQEAAKARAAKSDKEDCICRMSSRDSQTLLILAPTVADTAYAASIVVDLNLLGTVSSLKPSFTLAPDLSLATPPPRG